MLFTKMEPSESDTTADLMMSVSKETVTTPDDLLNNLIKGAELSFRAKLVKLGNANQLTHLHALEIVQTGKVKNLIDITVHES